VVVAIHAHQGDRRPHQPRAFLRDVAHAFVEGGADLVAISGPHTLAPVEAYRGRAIVYGLGNFFWHDLSEPSQRYLIEQPSEAIAGRLAERLGAAITSDRDVLELLSDDWEEDSFYDALLARLVFERGAPARLELLPISLVSAGPRTVRGIPQTADTANAKRILGFVAEVSAPIGTEVRVEGDRGVVDLTTA
jgi:Bacterial capsule synthesis protein PGA_cap